VLADTAGRRRDYSGNCVSLGVLDWVEPRAGTQARFSGQNGELARGFYYPFQPASPRTTGTLARALVRWRLMANERASGGLFTAEATAAGVRRAIQTTVALLERPGGDWLTATDVLYLDWRMQRWVGTDWSAAEQTRPILAPFFHAPYIEWALGAPPRAKRASKLLARPRRDRPRARAPADRGRRLTALALRAADRRPSRAGPPHREQGLGQDPPALRRRLRPGTGRCAAARAARTRGAGGRAHRPRGRRPAAVRVRRVRRAGRAAARGLAGDGRHAREPARPGGRGSAGPQCLTARRGGPLSNSG
jgi:hypothetical protein